MSGHVAYLRGENAEEAVLLGWICLLAHSLFLPILPLVPALGYLVATARAMTEDEPALPPVGFRSLFGSGVRASAICLAYGLVPIAVGAITITLAGTAAIDPGSGESILFLTGSTVTLFVVLTGLYLLPIALCRYATGDLRDSFLDRTVLPVATHAAYFIGWTSALVLFAAGWFAGGVIELVPIFGPILAPLIWWVVSLAATRRIAVGYRAT